MTELTENGVQHDTVRPEESMMAALKDQSSLEEVFNNSLEISEDVALTGHEDSEADSGEEPEHGNREHDGQKACPPPGDPTDAESKDWKPGSQCWVHSEDGLVHPAVILWVKGQRCPFCFHDYNNEEEQDVNCLLSPDELSGPGTAAVPDQDTSDGRMSVKGPVSTGTRQAKERPGNQSNMGKEADERKGRQQTAGAEKRANHSFPLFPPFPPPPLQCGSRDSSSFLPPPVPPPWMLGEKESDGSPGTEAMSSMLMVWYMCGFHTGSFMAQQMFKSASKD